MSIVRKIDASTCSSNSTLLDVLVKQLPTETTVANANAMVEDLTNLTSFFEGQSELATFQATVSTDASLVAGDCGRQWGDFQTPLALAVEVCNYLGTIGCRPKIVVEPTCGEGSFIKAATESFSGYTHIYGIEIQPGYASETNLALLRQALAHGPFSGKITINHDDIFMHRFPDWLVSTQEEVLILGNPPWVTNAELSTLDSMNLPVKENFKGHPGLDAMTGKSNFDISEAIILKLLETFGQHKGYLALLCKNSVIRNIVQELPRRRFRVAGISSFSIDAKKHFNASVEASLLVMRLGAPVGEAKCSSYPSIGASAPSTTFGWTRDKFVADVDAYERWAGLDGECPYVWRQGLKHDCSKAMELGGDQGRYQNGLDEVVELEPESVYPLLKSSDLKGFCVGAARFRVPVTQRKIGEETAWIEERFPRLWSYLEGHKHLFEARKSSIYRGKPKYSIFGIGEYSFAPFKVAISGMYKTGVFTLVEPQGGQPVMLDDTCYFLGFDSYTDALLVCSALNSEVVQGFLKSVVFLDAKRPYTKDLLMRIDLKSAFRRLKFSDIQAVWTKFHYEPTNGGCREADFQEFLHGLGLGKDRNQFSFLL